MEVGAGIEIGAKETGWWSMIRGCVEKVPFNRKIALKWWETREKPISLSRNEANRLTERTSANRPDARGPGNTRARGGRDHLPRGVRRSQGHLHWGTHEHTPFALALPGPPEVDGWFRVRLARSWRSIRRKKKPPRF